MYKDLSLKEKAKVLLYGGKLGLTSVEDIAKLYDDAISHKFAEGSIATPDWDPNNPYHYHTANGEKVVITPEDWEKHKGLSYFKQVEDAVSAEQAAYPGPEYIINPKFSEDLRRVYKGNMGPSYQNYSSFSGNLPQGYSFTPEGLVLDNQGNLYVLKGFRQTPRFTYDENNPLVFPVLEGRNKGNVTFYPMNMEKTIKPSLPISSIMNVDKEHESAIRKAQNQYEYIVTPWDILPNHEGGFYGYGDTYENHKLWTTVYDNNFQREVSDYLTNLFNRPIELNRTAPEDTKITITPKEFELVKKKLKDSYNEDNRREIELDKEWYNKYKDLNLHDTLEKQAEYKRVHDEYQQSLLDWMNQPNPWARYLMDGSIEDQSPKPRKISHKEAEKKAVIEVGPLQVNGVLTHAQGGPIVSPYGLWKYPGKDTIIPSNNITMNNVNYPVLGISDAGDTKVMMPWNDYKFRGSVVYEHPLIDNQFQLGGNIKPTFDLWYPTVPNQKNDTSSYDLRRAYNALPFDEMEKFRTINDYHLPSVAYDEKTDTYTFLKRNGHPTLNYELDWYNSGSPDALEFRERYKLDTLSLPWRYVPNYAKGGSIHIDPKNKGKLTETMRRTGKSKYELAHSKNPLTRKRALFAINASHWKHDEGGHLFLENGQIFKRPLDDLTGRNILTSPLLPPKSWYELFTIPELEPKKPQPLQPLEGTYGNKYSELIPMSDGTYVNNPINKGLQQDWRTHALEFAPFLAIGAGPAIGSTATWLASKPALYNLGRMTLGSEIGGRSVDLASNIFTDNTWGQNVGNVVEGITGWNPNNTMVGLFVTDLTNPGNYFDLSRLWKTGLAASPLVTRRNSVRQTNTQTNTQINNQGSDFDIEEARNMLRSFEPDYIPSQNSRYNASLSGTPRELLLDLENMELENLGLVDPNNYTSFEEVVFPSSSAIRDAITNQANNTYTRTVHTLDNILEDLRIDDNININPNILTRLAKFPRLTNKYRSFIENNQTFGPTLSKLNYTINDYRRLRPNLRKGLIEDSGHALWDKLHKPQDGDITGLSYFNMSPKNAVERATRDMERIPVGGRFILDYANATSHNSYPLSLHMMNSYISPNFNVKPSKFFGLQRMIPLNGMGFATDDVLKSTNRNIIRLNKDRGLKLPLAYLKDGTVFVPAVYAERIYDIGGYLKDLIPYYSL